MVDVLIGAAAQAGHHSFVIRDPNAAALSHRTGVAGARADW
jgi:hypothetical protein